MPKANNDEDRENRGDDRGRDDGGGRDGDKDLDRVIGCLPLLRSSLVADNNRISPDDLGHCHIKVALCRRLSNMVLV